MCLGGQVGGKLSVFSSLWGTFPRVMMLMLMALGWSSRDGQEHRNWLE